MAAEAAGEVGGLLASFADLNGREYRADEVWISLRNPEFAMPAQGWKLHVSARPGTLAETVARALPVLLAEGCDFKVARSPEVLRELNSGDKDPGAVGKALTAYPAEDRAVALGHALAEALAGLAGPRVASDRRVRPDAPVYYRYAPFLPQFRVDDNGDFELVVVGPDGEGLPGAAGAEFTCPPWTSDPFRPRPAADAAPAPAEPGERAERLLGGRYRVTSGVMRGPRGSVYRAAAPDGRAVIVKESRAYVGERADGHDLRLYLRNELRVLTALRGVAGVPRAVDHFRHGDDEYLVMTDAGSRDLNRAVIEDGAYADGRPGRDLGELASRLLAVLDAVHARGVVVRDLSPKNVVLGDDGACTLIDFGTSRHEDLQLPGYSRGYSVPDQRTGRPSVPADDHFSLGATLFFAATGMNPVMIDPDPERAAERTLQVLARRFPGVRTGVVGLLPALLGPDPAARTAAAAEIRAGRHGAAHRTNTRPLAVTPRLTRDLLSAVLDHTAAECARFAEGLMEEPADRRASPPVTNVYGGSAGVGMELLHHAGTRALAGDLARWTVGATPPTVLPPALYFGRTGTALFLAAAGVAAPGPVRLTGAERADQAHGLAGIGTGHLALARLDPGGADAHLAVAAECARRLAAGEHAEAPEPPAPLPPDAGVAVDAAYAHGDAGIADFLLAHHQATGDTAALDAARIHLDAMLPDVTALADALRGDGAKPMGASWCQGVSGVTATLLRAADVYGDDGLLDLAVRIGHGCIAVAPRAWVASQCCGLAGMGEALVDLALATGDDTWWRGAEEVVELMLVRSGGTPRRPVLPGNDLDTPSFTWGTGAAGVLSFLRRLDRREGARLWTDAMTAP
ncbi:class IV lanthionine synthetase LanL [Actinomadura parmotrematis]|uniref:non-specific serine/threonine protein kinase n=1 Tax=Actinomadura parmotrematis TaxID=2864039 RepID=A0ABS7FYE5_9ACTN|nr:class IV lanthionine synthetase LanL [Actinomadura parmotrematis]MBW8485452.1 class IV lanthionine synthetase LanL [Actinomadura parmotrematis]